MKETDLEIIKKFSNSLIDDAVKRHIEKVEEKDPRYINGNIVLLPSYHAKNIEDSIYVIKEEFNSINNRLSNEVRQQVKAGLNIIDMALEYVKRISEPEKEENENPKVILPFPSSGLNKNIPRLDEIDD